MSVFERCYDVFKDFVYPEVCYFSWKAIAHCCSCYCLEKLAVELRPICLSVFVRRRDMFSNTLLINSPHDSVILSMNDLRRSFSSKSNFFLQELLALSVQLISKLPLSLRIYHNHCEVTIIFFKSYYNLKIKNIKVTTIITSLSGVNFSVTGPYFYKIINWLIRGD